MGKCLGTKRKSLGLGLPLIFLCLLGLDNVQRGENQGQQESIRKVVWSGQQRGTKTQELEDENKFRLENKQHL